MNGGDDGTRTRGLCRDSSLLTPPNNCECPSPGRFSLLQLTHASFRNIIRTARLSEAPLHERVGAPYSSGEAFAQAQSRLMNNFPEKYGQAVTRIRRLR